jgi:hypothetical protein
LIVFTYQFRQTVFFKYSRKRYLLWRETHKLPSIKFGVLGNLGVSYLTQVYRAREDIACPLLAKKPPENKLFP